MMTRKMLWAATREWLSGLTALSMVLAPIAGCPTSVDLGTGNGNNSGGKDNLTSKSAGFFINDDHSSDLLVAGRDDAGDGFFVYGTRNSSGDIGEIQSIALRTGDGTQKSFLTFESGRPVHAEAPDGSYAHVTYTEVTSTRLTGNVDIFNAGDGSVSHLGPYTVDLQEAIDNVVKQVQDATGIGLTVVQPVGSNTVETHKALSAARTITIIPLYTAFVIPCASLVYATTVILGELLTAVIVSLVEAIQNVIIAIFTPLILLSRIMSEVVLHVHVIRIVSIFSLIPDPPIIVLH